MGFAGYRDNFDERIIETEKLPGHKAKVKGIVDGMKSTKSKTSAIGHNEAVALIGNATKKRRQIITAEIKTEGAHIVAEAGKRIIFNYLGISKPGHNTAVSTKISVQRIIVGGQLA